MDLEVSEAACWWATGTPKWCKNALVIALRWSNPRVDFLSARGRGCENNPRQLRNPTARKDQRNLLKSVTAGRWKPRNAKNGIQSKISTSARILHLYLGKVVIVAIVVEFTLIRLVPNGRASVWRRVKPPTMMRRTHRQRCKCSRSKSVVSLIIVVHGFLGMV